MQGKKLYSPCWNSETKYRIENLKSKFHFHQVLLDTTSGSPFSLRWAKTLMDKVRSSYWTIIGLKLPITTNRIETTIKVYIRKGRESVFFNDTQFEDKLIVVFRTRRYLLDNLIAAFGTIPYLWKKILRMRC